MIRPISLVLAVLFIFFIAAGCGDAMTPEERARAQSEREQIESAQERADQELLEYMQCLERGDASIEECRGRPYTAAERAEKLAEHPPDVQACARNEFERGMNFDDAVNVCAAFSSYD